MTRKLEFSTPKFVKYTLKQKTNKETTMIEQKVTDHLTIDKPELGTEAIEKVLEAVSDIVVDAIKTFADGFQLSDATFIPGAIGKSIVIAKETKDAIAEIKDLSAEEAAELFGKLIPILLDAFDVDIKKEPRV